MPRRASDEAYRHRPGLMSVGPLELVRLDHAYLSTSAQALDLAEDLDDALRQAEVVG